MSNTAIRHSFKTIEKHEGQTHEVRHDSSVTQQQHEEKPRKQQFRPKNQSKNIRSALVKDKGSINLPCYYLERARGTNLSPS